MFQIDDLAAMLARDRVNAAELVVKTYRSNATEYNNANREFGLDAAYADCSSTVTTILMQAGQEDIFEGRNTATMRQEIASKPENNSYRFDNPLPGDIMMWGGHVAVVTEVKMAKFILLQWV